MATTTLPMRPHRNNQPVSTKRPRRNIVNDFGNYFGNESQLANWQRLCDDVGLADDLPSIKKCRLALKSVFINIHDLVDKLAVGEMPRRFDNARQLATWTLKNNKVYPKARAKEGGPVRALLIHIF